MTRLLVILVISLVLARIAWAKITIDSTSQSAFASATSVTWAHTLGTCANSCLIAACANDASTFSSITFNGIALTQQVHFTSTETSDIWTLCNSTWTGTHNIIATNGASVNVICSAVSLCGVNPNTPKDSSATSQATGTNPSIADTIISSGSWVIDNIFNNGTTITDPPRAQQNVAGSMENSGGPSTQSTQFNGPFIAGSRTLSWSEPTSAAWTKVIMGVAASTGTPILLTNPPTAITQTTATGNGVMLNAAGFAISASGVCVSTFTNPDTTTSCFAASSTGTFTAAITGLLPGTSYHVRAYGTNSQGTDYGVDIPFVTGTNTGVFTTPGYATTIPISPSVCSNVSSTGTVAWTTPTNAQDFNVNITTAGTISMAASITDDLVELEVGGSFQANQSTGAVWISLAAGVFPLPLQVYGGPSSLLGATTLHGSDLQTSNFGLMIQGQGANSESNGLQCNWQLTNAQVPANALVTGLKFNVYKGISAAAKSLVGDTQVYTPMGEIRLKNLRVGDPVYGWDGNKLVVQKIARIKNKYDPELITIKTQSDSITGTPQHIFYTQKGLMPMSQMKVGTFLRRNYSVEPILSITRKKGNFRTYEVYFKDDPHNYFANGFLVHNVTSENLMVDYESLQVTYTPGGGNIATTPGIGEIDIH